MMGQQNHWLLWSGQARGAALTQCKVCGSHYWKSAAQNLNIMGMSGCCYSSAVQVLDRGSTAVYLHKLVGQATDGGSVNSSNRSLLPPPSLLIQGTWAVGSWGPPQLRTQCIFPWCPSVKIAPENSGSNVVSLLPLTANITSLTLLTSQASTPVFLFFKCLSGGAFWNSCFYFIWVGAV